MNTALKILVCLLRGAICFFALAAITPVSLANNVVAPAKRQESLSKAKELLAEKPLLLISSNPFNPDGFGESAAESHSSLPSATGGGAVAGPRSGRELLQAIGTSLKPSGFFVLSGEPTLVFGQKRVKAGGLLTITFEGNEYTLEIVSINQPNFTLRLNREEFTRPIK